ncbi:hypothetical protein PSN45_003303 [Yamadazyma tenuis]|uniref:Formamidopyrimidine-DNA glycosylase catalytic domain-containing protein n=1 Tax=Candida tenuis (strain ATCC 10573 / BCRC 21748 / CBS 615 / JCM 9827 / NBRC 10315 / NRRL Y-1498 / VKM Y-70) TaxID=590646 RepID=G3AYN2_CANTC|nr:uncharacterized protein CANTEDRAFT_133319 [Yamadazyma tenuis ATCC 10573]EGV65894.1 hypothetical protein CANTEDRAFT_133319 [Yamadazyma tenuis ATCC 10573]WEJ95776.1 hypothetical protein PSN45_003303 [Yamadazyma tenuis]
MPEVAEVAHVCAQLRRNIIGYRITGANILNDSLLFPSLKGNNEPEGEIRRINSLLDGAVVEKVGRHGKYFWIRFNNQVAMLMHFGMTGMIKLKNIDSHMVFMENGGDKKILETKVKVKEESTSGSSSKTTSKYFAKKESIKEVDNKKQEQEQEQEQWPPNFSKMELKLKKEKELDLSFVDPRRLGRIRFFTDITKDEDLFNLDPLKRQGPDYSKSGLHVTKIFEYGDPDPKRYIELLSLPEFAKLVISKKKTIKSLLLEQDYFAGVGNWVSDEILYQSRIHPGEVLSEKLDSSSPVIEALYNALISVCYTAVSVEGDVKKFPEEWLMLYRWGKRRTKQAKAKVGGHPVDFVTIGGRTACFVPKVQKKL